MRRTPPKVHRWCHPYGDARHDPWPGDLAMGGALMSVYRFVGWGWVVLALQR